MARTPSDQPTDAELEILQVLWESGPSGLGHIFECLNRRRQVAKTTVATVLTVMLQKELVERSRGDRGSLWSAKVTRQTATDGLIGKLLERVFDGSAKRLVAHLLESNQLSKEEHRELARLLEASRQKR